MTKQTIPQSGEVMKAIKGLGTKLKSLKAAIPRIAINCVLVAIEHSDIRPANQLVELLKDDGQLRANAMIEWLETHGPVKWDKDEKKFLFDATRRRDMHKAMQATTLPKYVKPMQDNPWTDKKEPEYKGFDFQKQLHALIARAQKIASDETKASDEKTNLEGFDTVYEFVKGMDSIADNDDTPTSDDDEAIAEVA